jgi:hypothetical protein
MTNAIAENFFSILKTECIYMVKPKTLAEAKLLIEDYIRFYNNERVFKSKQEKRPWRDISPLKT